MNLNLTTFLNTKGVSLNDSPLFKQLIINIKNEEKNKAKDKAKDKAKEK